MTPAAAAIASTVMLGFVATYADYLLKVASAHPRPFREWAFPAACLLYALTAIGWVYVMRHLNLACIGAIFSVSTTVALAVVGALIFREPMRARDFVGIGLAIASILLLSRPD